MAATIIDNGTTGFSTVGSWGSSSGGSGYYGSNYATHAAGSGTNKAKWNFTSLTASTPYFIGASWAGWVGNSTVVPWTIFDSDGTTTLASGTLDQTVAASGVSSGGVIFKILGSSVTPSGTSLTLQFTDGGSGGQVIADAGLIQPASDPMTYGSISNGNWSSAAIWSPSASGHPTAGDSVSIGNAVTVDANTSCGLTAFTTGGTPAISINSGGSLTIATGVTLTLSGDLKHTATSTVTMNAGSTLIFKPPSGQQAVWDMSTGGPQAVINGSSGSRCTVKTDKSLGGSAAYIKPNAGAADSGITTASYTDFIDLGSSTKWGINTVISGSTNPAYSVTNCTFTRCNWTLNIGSSTYDQNITITGNSLSSSIAYTAQNNDTCYFIFNNPTTITGTRTLSGNAFDGFVEQANLKQFTIQYNLYGAGLLNGSTHKWTAFDSNLVWITAIDSGRTMLGDVTNCYWMQDTPAGTNPHGMLFQGNSEITSVNLSGNLYDYNGTDASGNFITVSDGSSVTTINVKYNIVLPNDSGISSGVLLTMDGNQSNNRAYVEHNTAHVDGQWGLEIGHGQTVVESPTRYQSVQGNLFWGSATTGYIANNVDSTTLQDIIPPANADYNGKYGVKLTSGIGNFVNEGRGYAAKWSVTPGAHDISGDPQFVASTRKLSAWAAAQGQGTTGSNYAAAKAYLAADPTTRIPAMIAWVRAGYVPKNAIYKGASFSGDSSTTDAAGNPWAGGATPDIGAMAVATYGVYLINGETYGEF